MLRSMMIFVLALSLSSIVSAQTPLVVDQNTIALWNFDSDSGNSVTDLGVNNLSGTSYFTDLAPMQSVSTDFANGRFFKDQRSYISFGNLQQGSPLDLSALNNWSVEFMVNLNGQSIGPRNVFDNGRVGIQIVDRRVVAFVKTNGVSTGVKTLPQLSVNTPYRIAIVFANGRLGIKVNGQTWAASDIAKTKKVKKISEYNQPIQVGGTPREAISKFEIGRAHGCLVNEFGDMSCWGWNDYGQLGDGTYAQEAFGTQVRVKGINNPTEIGLGLAYTCVLVNKRTHCWGINDENNLGFVGPLITPVPTEVQTALDADQLSVGEYHTCILTTDKRVQCWGYNAYGQLGIGIISESALPTILPGLSNIKKIGMGRYHSCAIDDSGKVFCWGLNSSGQIGQSFSVPSNSVPQQVPGITNAVKLALGDQHSCALLATNEVKCWGGNNFGQLGSGNFTFSFNPVSVINIPSGDILDIGARYGDHTCILNKVSASQSLLCWGRNFRNQIGKPDPAQNFNVPTLAAQDTSIQKISIGSYVNSYQSTSNLIYSFGSNAFGLLGTFNLNTFTYIPAPIIATKQGFIEGNLDDIRISNVARGTLVQPVLALVGPVDTSSVNNPQINISVQSIQDLNATTLSVKLNDSFVGGLSLNGNSISGILSTPLLFGENRLEVTIHDIEGNIGQLVSKIKYSAQLDPSKPVKVASRGETSCYLNGLGEVYCWGSNAFGQLGRDDIRHSSTPIKNPYLKNIQQLAVSLNSICAVDRSSKVYCWGDNALLQLGNQDFDRRKRSIPDLVTLVKPFSKIVAGGTNFCALNLDGTVTCWGENPLQSFGNIGFVITKPTDYALLNNIKDIAIGNLHVCFIKNDNTLWCAGHNASGQVGHGNNSNIEPVGQVSGLQNVKSVSLTRGSTCASTYDNKIYCWGNNNSDHLGTHTNSNLPVEVTVLNGDETYYNGESTSCAVNASNEISCWGQNVFGEIGDGTFTNNSTPVAIPNLHPMDFSFNQGTACLVNEDQKLYCWGKNNIGQAGIPSMPSVGAPTEVVPHQAIYQNLSSVVAGQANTCMKMSGETYCWGNNEMGQLAIGNSNFQEVHPVKVNGLEHSTQSSIGYALTCHLRPDSKAVCAGMNNFGQAGVDPQTSDRVYNPNVIALENVMQVEAGLDFACAVKSEGTVWCWGNNVNGQLGNGSFVANYTPQQVSGLTNVNLLSISSRGNHACAKTLDGSLYCWGLNSSGQLGASNPANSNTPLQVAKVSNVEKLALGSRFTCVLNTDSKVICFGANSFGQLGTGNNYQNTSFNPVALTGNISDLKAGEDFACALDELNVVRCWGRNDGWQLGNGRDENSNVPVKVISGVDSLAVGSLHSCVITNKNKLACWGFNGNGQFGDGSLVSSIVPTYSDITKK